MSVDGTLPLNPAAVQPAPASAPAMPAAQPAPAAAAAAAQNVTIPLEQLNVFTAMQARLAKIEEDRARDAADAQRAAAEALAKKGELENAFTQLRQQSEQAVQAERAKLMAAEERAKRYALDNELTRNLAAQPLVPGGAEQLTQLWRNQFNVDPQGDSFAVRTPTMQSVGDYIAAQLGRPEFAHFLRPNSTGGTGGASPAGQSAPTAPANAAPPVQPRNFSEAVILEMANRQKSTLNPLITGGITANPDGTVTRTPLPGFGLRAVK